jgi:hypothetical protein
MVGARKEIFIAVLDPNFCILIERDQAADLIVDRQELGDAHVFVIGIGRDPQLQDCFVPVTDLTAAIDGIKVCRFYFSEVIPGVHRIARVIDEQELFVG